MRAILFDFGGTLDYPCHWLDRFLAHYRAAGLRLRRAELEPAYAYATEKAYRAGRVLRSYGLAELVRFLVGLQLDHLVTLGPNEIRIQPGPMNGGYDGLARRISQDFVAESLRGLGRSKEVLSALARRFKLGVVSNFYGNLDRVLDEAGMLGLMQVVVDSARLEVFKPDLRIFKAALEALDIEPTPGVAASAAMVGDSLDKDCAPARRLGLKTIWLRHPGSDALPADAGMADYTVHSLEELKELKW